MTIVPVPIPILDTIPVFISISVLFGEGKRSAANTSS